MGDYHLTADGYLGELDLGPYPGVSATHYNKQSVANVLLTAAGADATVELRDGGASGTVRLTLSAKAGESAEWSAKHPGLAKRFTTDCYVNLTGAGATVDIDTL